MEIKDNKNKKVFELVKDDGDICLKVNGKCIVQFVENDNKIGMFTNFDSNYEELNIEKHGN